jgi:hypothetical protein
MNSRLELLPLILTPNSSLFPDDAFGKLLTAGTANELQRPGQQ